MSRGVDLSRRVAEVIEIGETPEWRSVPDHGSPLTAPLVVSFALERRIFPLNAGHRYVRARFGADDVIVIEQSSDGRVWEEVRFAYEGRGAQLRLADNAAEELVDLARAHERKAFWALAACLMPVEQIAECWDGCRARLGLAAS